MGYRKNEGIDLGECKWGTKSVTPSVVDQLKEKMEKYPNPKNLTVQGHLFTQLPCKWKSKFPGVLFHALDEMYGL